MSRDSITLCVRAVDILLSVPEEWCDVQNVMSEVCELCWVRDEDVEDREQLVPNCLLYLVARTFSQGATVSQKFYKPVKNVMGDP